MALTWSPVSLVLITTGIATLYTMMEWLFIFTRPSFLRTVSLMEKSRAFFSTSSIMILASLLALAPFLLLAAWIKNPGVKKALQALALLVPSLMLTATLLLLVDNFTYTLFQFGIVSTVGVWRAAYAILSLLALVYLLTRLADLTNLLIYRSIGIIAHESLTVNPLPEDANGWIFQLSQNSWPIIVKQFLIIAYMCDMVGL